jgi:hypothetical protein
MSIEKRHHPKPPLPGEGGTRRAGGTRVIFKSYRPMRTITIMTTAAGALAAALAFAPSANAERLCRQACDQAGFCQSVCVEDDHVFMDNAEKDFYLRHGQPDAFLGR